MPLYDLDENQRSEPLPEEELQQFKAHLEHLRSHVVGQGIVAEVQTAPKLLIGKPGNQNGQKAPFSSSDHHNSSSSTEIIVPNSTSVNRTSAHGSQKSAFSPFNSSAKPFYSNQFGTATLDQFVCPPPAGGPNNNSLLGISPDESWPAPPPPLAEEGCKGSFLSSMINPARDINNSLNNLSLQVR